jgi:quinol monooxygenase YgiN
VPGHILEVAEITVTDAAAFEAGVSRAKRHFLSAEGCLGLSLHRVIEAPATYRLVVKWRSVEDHMITFRNSPAFQAWRDCVSAHFSGSPVVTHSRQIEL